MSSAAAPPPLRLLPQVGLLRATCNACAEFMLGAVLVNEARAERGGSAITLQACRPSAADLGSPKGALRASSNLLTTALRHTDDYERRAGSRAAAARLRLLPPWQAGANGCRFAGTFFAYAVGLILYPCGTKHRLLADRTVIALTACFPAAVALLVGLLPERRRATRRGGGGGGAG